MSLDAESQKRLEELERQWAEKFVQQPKLPSSALLTTVVSMALAFGGVLFLLSKVVRPYAWIWFATSFAIGVLSIYFARRWYTHVVVPWGTERRAVQAEIEDLRRKREA